MSYITKENPFGFHLVEVPVGAIKPHPKNPRTIDAGDRRQLKKSLDKFGLIDRPILNPLPEAEGDYQYLCLAGHQRMELIKTDKSISVVECWIPEKPLTQEEEDELLIRHNKNQGKFDIEKLNQFEFGKLVDYGFKSSELPKLIDEEDNVGVPTYPITPKFSEKHGYVIIYYDNDIDKVNLETMLELEQEKDFKTSNIATGRVITFDKFKKLVSKWKK